MSDDFIATDPVVDLEEFLKLAKRYGCARLKARDFEVVFFPPELTPQTLDPKALHDPLETAVSEEEVRLWHVGGSGYQDSKGDDVVPPLMGESDGDG